MTEPWVARALRGEDHHNLRERQLPPQHEGVIPNPIIPS